jgi:PAS domain S-box-containing protein
MKKPSRQDSADPLSIVPLAVRAVLDELALLVCVIDATGRLRWANAAATELIGSCVGRSYVSCIPRDWRKRARQQFARNVVGGSPASCETVLVNHRGRQISLNVHSAPLRTEGKVLGVLALATLTPDGRRAITRRGHCLTPRQVEVLHFLAEGSSTEAIAAGLGIAVETARNHVRSLLSRLGVHSRLEAVAEARRRGLLKSGEDE